MLVLALAAIFCCISFPALSQLPDPTTLENIPVPGVGHSYIGLGTETVDPASGSVVFRLPVEAPSGRQLNFPFAIKYEESIPFTIVGAAQETGNAPGALAYTTRRIQDSTSEPFSINGWSYTLPYYRAAASIYATQGKPGGCGNPYSGGCNGASVDFCWKATNYSYQGLEGRTYGLSVQNQWPDPSNSSTSQTTFCGVWGQGGSGSGDRNSFISLSAPSASDGPSVQPAATITEGNGTSYIFPKVVSGYNPAVTSGGTFSSLAQSITDRNGNQIIYNGTTVPQSLGPSSSGSYLDTLGRPIVTWSGLGNPSGDTLSISGHPNNITVHWTTTNVTFPSQPGNISVVNGSCGIGSAAPQPISVVSEIDLPNQTSYKFTYGGLWGRLIKIQFPDGGYVRYDWGIAPRASDVHTYWQILTGGAEGGCEYLADDPAIVGRHVSYDGNTEVLDQTFSYATNWPAYSTSAFFLWQSKSTTVNTTDKVSGQSSTTIYNYGSTGPFNSAEGLGQATVETSIITKDSAGNLLQTENQAWFDKFTKVASQYIDDQGNSKTTLICADQWSRPVAKYEFGYVADGPASSLPGCATAQRYGGNTTGLAFGLNTNSIGPLLRQTAYAYSSALTFSNILNAPTSIIAQDPNGVRQAEVDYGYDESPVLPSGVTTNIVSIPSNNRGNLTSISNWLDTTNSFTKKTFTYFDTGNLNTITDACGNLSCPDMVGTNHTTTLTYRDTTLSGPASTDTEAFVTQVSSPLPNSGASQISHYTWDYDASLLTSKTDANSQLTKYNYNDSLKRLTDIYDPPSSQNSNVMPHTSYQYTDGSQPSITQINPIGVTSVDYFDGMGHKVKHELTTGSTAEYVDTVYTGTGKVYSTTNPYRNYTETTYGKTTLSYDVLGRKVAESHTDGTSHNWIYIGNLSLESDESTHNWARTMDSLGRLSQVRENAQVSTRPIANNTGGVRCGLVCSPAITISGGLVTQYTYDLLDNLKLVNQIGDGINDIPRARSFTYDSLSRLLTSTNPETGTICYGQWSGGPVGSGTCQNGYDSNGNLISKTDARGITTTYSYDPLNRLTRKTYSDGSLIAAFGYDGLNEDGIPIPNFGMVSQNAVGRLSVESNQYDAGIVYSYDSMGHIVKQYDDTPQRG